VRRVAIVLAAGSSALLLAMVAVSITTGATQEAYEYVGDRGTYAKSLLEHASGVRLVFALDIAFIALYTGFFAALARILRGQPFVTIALGAMLVTALLDIVEDHRILSVLAASEQGGRPDLDSLIFQQTLSSTKFSVSYVALFLFGLAIPRTTKLGWALALFLTVGTLATAVAGYAAPPEMRAQLDGGRWIGFLIGFGIAALWLKRANEPATAP
jgi:hypothetical protein